VDAVKLRTQARVSEILEVLVLRQVLAVSVAGLEAEADLGAVGSEVTLGEVDLLMVRREEPLPTVPRPDLEARKETLAADLEGMKIATEADLTTDPAVAAATENPLASEMAEAEGATATGIGNETENEIGTGIVTVKVGMAAMITGSGIMTGINTKMADRNEGIDGYSGTSR